MADFKITHEFKRAKTEAHLRLESATRLRFRRGLSSAPSASVAGYYALSSIVSLIAYEFAEVAVVDLDTSRQRDCNIEVHALIVWTDGVTKATPLSVTSKVANVNGTPIYLDHQEGPVELLYALLGWVEAAIAENAARKLKPDCLAD